MFTGKMLMCIILQVNYNTSILDNCYWISDSCQNITFVIVFDENSKETMLKCYSNTAIMCYKNNTFVIIIKHVIFKIPKKIN